MPVRRKKSSPALYELIKTGPARGSGDDDRPPAGEPPPAEPGGWLTPGRAMSVPVGYVLLGIGIVGIVMAATYIMGYGRGRAEGVAEKEAEFAEDLAVVTQPRPRDPLVGSGSDPSGVFGRPEEEAPDDAATGSPAPPEARPTPGGWGPLTSDPREGGRKYLVLMETHLDGAVKLAEYCRQQGLETYVVVSQNKPSRRMVIAMPGFELAVSSNSPEMQALRRRVHEIGDSWKRQEDGVTDLHDAYPLPYVSTPSSP